MKNPTGGEIEIQKSWTLVTRNPDMFRIFEAPKVLGFENAETVELLNKEIVIPLYASAETSGMAVKFGNLFQLRVCRCTNIVAQRMWRGFY